jgi:hypothetical protein
MMRKEIMLKKGRRRQWAVASRQSAVGQIANKRKEETLNN